MILRPLKRLALALAALALAAPPLLAAEFTDAQKREIDQMIRAYILENPEVLVEAMEVLESRQQQAQDESDRALVAMLSDELFNDGYSHVAGNPDGDVTLVEFLDYRCGYCKQAHEGVQALVASDPGIRYVIKEFPILGPDSTFASRAAMAALAQGDALYMALNDALMTHKGALDEAAVLRIAGEVGLDAARLRLDMENPEIAEHIRETYGLARKLSINGTPAFIIGERIVRGFIPYDSLKELVEEARRAG